MIRKLGHEAEITSDPQRIADAKKLILPGVGHFDFGMKNLHSSGLVPVLHRKVLEEKTPILGICLGVQLFMKGSDEGSEPGLGWIDGYTRAFDKTKMSAALKIPHMGWSEVSVSRQSTLFSGFDEVPRFYFVHSFHLTCHQQADVLAHSSHGYPFVAAVEHENIVGVQFHPEKSHRFGMVVLKNFLQDFNPMRHAGS